MEEIKKVLVLCQRKKGIDEKDRKIEEVIIPKITNVIEKLMGKNYSVTYMTDMTKMENGETDIDCLLNGETECSKKFIEENKGSYDLIILHTCPFRFIEYNIIYNLLKPTGKLVLSSLPGNIITDYDFFKTQPDAIKNIKSSNFQLVAKSEGVIIYIKNTDGKRSRRKSKRSRRKSKRSRRKSKRSRRKSKRSRRKSIYRN
jgi:hypothetical protein